MEGQHVLSVKKGDKVSVGNEIYSIEDAKQIDKAKIRSDTSGEVYPADLTNKLRNNVAGQSAHNQGFLTQDEKQYERFSKKMEVVRRLQHLPNRTTKDVEKVSAELGYSARTSFRILARYRAEGQRGLLRSANFGGKGKPRINREAEAILQQLLSEYLSDQRKSASIIYEEIFSECHKYGIKKPPSYHTVLRRIKQLDDRVVVESRLGSKAFSQKYGISQGSYVDNKHPLQTIMIDHNKLDIFLRDEITNEVLGKPWLTIGIDAYSRCIWGYHLGLDSPSADTDALTIRMGCFRKDKLVELFHLSEWPVFGIPSQIHTDNGKDFRAKLLERGCKWYDIDLIRRPVKRPQYSAIIERFFKTLNTKFIHNLPGTSRSNIADKGDYDSEKNSLLTIKDLERLLLEFIVNQYHNQLHSGLNMTPLQKWKSGLEGKNPYGCPFIPTEPEDEERFREDFLCFVEPDGKRVLERDGVHFKDLTYYAPELETLPQYESGNKKKYFIRFDPSDVRFVYIYDDANDCYYKLKSKDAPSEPCSLQDLLSARAILRKEEKYGAEEYIVWETILRRREFLREKEIESKKIRKEIASARWKGDIRRRTGLPEKTDDVETPVYSSPGSSIDFDPDDVVRLGDDV